MNMLKQSSPGHRESQSPIYGGRLTPSPHYTVASTPGSPLTTPQRTSGPTASSLLLQMGGENSAFKSLAPNSAAALLVASENLHRLSGYDNKSDSDEEINVNDESDDDRDRSTSSSPLEVVDSPNNKQTPTCQPLQLTVHGRD